MPYPVHRDDEFVEFLEDLQDPELISMVKKSRLEIEELYRIDIIGVACFAEKPW